jgi:hypothetical protein
MNPRRSIWAAFAALLGAIALVAVPAAAAAKDRNHDRIPDRWEQRHHLSLQVNQAHRDQDGDQLRNRAEFLAGDNPRDADSDNDGIEDGQENAGTVESFDAASGKLTIALFGGETISGLVTEATEIKCEHSAGASASDAGEGGSSGPGRGEEEPGDDHGEGVEPGDDHGGESATCTTTGLVPGAVVQQAEIEVEHGTASFHEVELG